MRQQCWCWEQVWQSGVAGWQPAYTGHSQGRAQKDAQGRHSGAQRHDFGELGGSSLDPDVCLGLEERKWGKMETGREKQEKEDHDAFLTFCLGMILFPPFTDKMREFILLNYKESW